MKSVTKEPSDSESHARVFTTLGFSRGICAGCKAELTPDYLGNVRGIGIYEKGMLGVRVCRDARYTDYRYPKARQRCLRDAEKNLAKLSGPDVEGLPKSEIERALTIWLRRVS